MFFLAFRRYGLGVTGFLLGLSLVSEAIGKSSHGSAAPPALIDTGGKIGYATQVADGRLLAVYPERRPSGQLNVSIPQRVFGRFSIDHGVHWGEPQLLFTLPQTPFQLGMVVPLGTRDGALHIFGFNWSGQQPDLAKVRADIWHVVSRDGGKGWEGPRNIDYGHQFTGALNSAIELKSGRILLPFSYLAVDPSTQTLARSNGLLVSDAVFSDDGGKTWRKSKNDVAIDCGGPDDHSGAAEPVTVELVDGRVWMVIRTQTGYLFESYSQDGGETWSSPRRTSFHSSNAPASVWRLKDGRVVLAWNNEPYDHGTTRIGYSGTRQSLVMAIHDGSGWRGYREIARPFGPKELRGQARYPYLAEAKDGKVVVVYPDNRRRSADRQEPNDGWVHQLVRVDPQWLLQSEALEDFSQGIKNLQMAGTAGAEVLPGPEGKPALHLQKLSSEQPSGATWNFPLTRRGSVHIRLRTEPGFQGLYFALSEYLLPPSNRQGGTFRWMIGADGKLKVQDHNEGPFLPYVSKQIKVLKLRSAAPEGQTHELSVEWNCETNVAELRVDGDYVAQLVGLEMATGMAYLRLFSATTPTREGKGLWVMSLRSESKR